MNTFSGIRFSIILFYLLAILSISCNSGSDAVVLHTEFLELSINEKGFVRKFTDKRTRYNHLSKDTMAPFISLGIDEKILHPLGLSSDTEKGKLIFTFPEEITAEIEVKEYNEYLSFELISIANPKEVDLIFWGPYPTKNNQSIGETVGIAQGRHFTLGLQSLNPKTLGGYPWNDNDCMPQIDLFEQDDLSDLSEEGKRHVLYRVEAAKPEEYGASLQAYTRNRNRERVTSNWEHENYTIPVYDDGGLIGSKIALFGCPNDSTLQTIGKIELAEGLPHPMIDGQWGKTQRTASAAYIIINFSEQSFEEALAITKKAGLRYLYHFDPFETWGHFELKKDYFPNGVEGLKKCVERAWQDSIYLGLHSLSNFITTNDKYVTPVPDSRLAKVGESILTSDINPNQKEIPIQAATFFNQFENNHMRTVQIGNELIQYDTVSMASPPVLINCKRGAFGTIVSTHKSGDPISKLADHGYKVFLTNSDLTKEMATRLAELYNKTGVRQISFDGLEGNRSTGMGNYGEILFTDTWYQHIDENIRSHYIADASRTSHYFWHMYTRMNWGEPWYAGFRESQTEYRMKNQKYFKRNLMPAMLGWFSLRPETTLEDVEWMLARSAAYNAGFAFIINSKTFDNHPQAEEILQAINHWEEARMKNIFGWRNRNRMEDLKVEFRLEKLDSNQWNLNRYYVNRHEFHSEDLLESNPDSAKYKFENHSNNDCLFEFVINARKGDIPDILLQLDSTTIMPLPVTLPENHYLKYSGGEQAEILDANWHFKEFVAIDTSAIMLSKGKHELTFQGKLSEVDSSYVKLEIRLLRSISNL